ncbi:MAG: hypothetical protein U0Q55_12000 [Vicinamibacterales bacterium]
MRLRMLCLAVALVGLVVTPARADVRITIADGKVSISAQNATIRQILTEWARVGQMKIVNAERVSGAPISLELADVPETQALDTVLRSVSGYLAAPRAVPLANASTYDRIYLLPTSTGSTARPAPPPTPGSGFAQPGFTPPPVFTPPVQDDQDDDEPRPQVVQPGTQPPNGPRGPAFTTFPAPQGPQPRQFPQAPQQGTPAQPAAPPQPTTTFGAPPAGGAPFGVSTPGMVVPAPQQQGPAGDRR